METLEAESVAFSPEVVESMAVSEYVQNVSLCILEQVKKEAEMDGKDPEEAAEQWIIENGAKLNEMSETGAIPHHRRYDVTCVRARVERSGKEEAPYPNF